jgi:hypothetical protein
VLNAKRKKTKTRKKKKSCKGQVEIKREIENKLVDASRVMAHEPLTTL